MIEARIYPPKKNIRRKVDSATFPCPSLPPSFPPSRPSFLPHLGGRDDGHIRGDKGSDLKKILPRVLHGDAMQYKVHAIKGGLGGGRDDGREMCEYMYRT